MNDNINNNLTAFESFLIKFQSQTIFIIHSRDNENLIKNLKNINSIGWDNIPTNILKTNVRTLAPILSNLINKSLAQGLFSQLLKRAKILPIFKSKDKLNIANYRPISILPVISKVYDFFYSRLHDYFSTNNLLSSSQFGFRSGASTEHALLKFTDDILKCFDDKKVEIATFMDLSKAFDCADQEILLTKSKRYGVHSPPLPWISSYISSREHYVSWNQIQSTSLNLNIGVPQGSILGPLLFLIYINDIVKSSNVLSFVLFADDTPVYVQNYSTDSAIEILIQNWPK